MQTAVLEVHRADIGTSRLVEEELPPLADGAVRLEVERFSITANTVTYAQFGDMLGYWDFYPSGDETFGRVPAMGWARVVESAHPGVEIGGRYYGWFPMAAHVDVVVGTTARGLRDDGEHRAAHAPVYRTFEDTRHDPQHPTATGVSADDATTLADREDRHALLRGLFLTGYLADGFLDANGWYGADHALVLSASSKTAIGFADCAARRDGLSVVGVTSTRNVDFVHSLGIYDSVVTYDDVADSVDTDGRVVVVDMAGNGPVLNDLHDTLGDRIGYSMVVGRTHHDAPTAAPSAGPTPEMFFAPTALQTMGEQGLDIAGFQAAIPAALADFIERSVGWLDVQRDRGPDGAAATWAAVHGGSVPPSTGRITSLHG